MGILRPSMMVCLVLWTIGASTTWGEGERRPFSSEVKASLVFREASLVYGKETALQEWGVPYFLLVYIRLENISPIDASWSCDSCMDIEAQLLDSRGVPVPQAPTLSMIPSNMEGYHLHRHDRLDWMISVNGVSPQGDTANQYVLAIGNRAWLIPRDSISTYSLKLTVRGIPWIDKVSSEIEQNLPHNFPILLDLPATPISFSDP